jgi:hypothetical protein
MLVCKTCRVQFPFATRTVKGEQIPMKNCDPCRAKVTAKVIAHNKTPKGKASMTRANKSDKGKERYKRFEKTEKGKNRLERHFKVRRERRLKDPTYKLSQNIRVLASNILQCRTNSPTFVAHTAFNSAQEYVQHLERKLVTLNPNWTMADRGTLWEPDHKIPIEVYDFSNPEDVKRCWSPANMHCMTVHDNREKRWKIIDAFCNEAGVASFPIAWNGLIPSDAEKEAFYAKCREKYELEDELDDESD